MEYTTGVVTKTSDFTSVVSVLINGKQKHRLFPFGRTIFYTYGLRCDGSMSNILEEGMEVGLCYKTPPFGEVVILAVWCGDPPETVEDDCTPPNLHDQRGCVSYFVDDENVLVQNDGGHYTVMISMDVLYCDGRRMKDNGAALSMGDIVTYDACPFDVEHPSGASYRATCAWFGPKAPRLMDRFHLTSVGKHEDAIGLDAHGVVVTIPNDTIAVVEVIFESDALKVLVFRNSFRVDFVSSIRDEVAVGDILWVRLGHFIVSNSKQLVATEAIKLNHDLPKTDIRAESHYCLAGDDIELDSLSSRTDQVPMTQNDVMKRGDKTGLSLFYSVPNCNAKVPANAQNGVRSDLLPDSDSYRRDVTDGEDEHYGIPHDDDLLSQNCSLARKTHCTKINDIIVPSKPPNAVTDGGSAVNGLTKHFNHVRSGTIPGRSLLNELKRDAKETVTEKKVRSYVGLGVKSVKSTEGVQEILEVANVISTYSAVLQVGKPRETSDNPNDSEPKTEGRSADKTFSTTDLALSDRSLASVTDKRAHPDENARDLAVILAESHISSEPCKPTVTGMTNKKCSSGSEKILSELSTGTEKPSCVTDVTASKNCNAVRLNSKPVRMNVDGVTAVFSESHFDTNLVERSALSINPPILYFNDPPLKGVFYRYSLDCGIIYFQNFKIFVKPDNFYIDGVPCPPKHFIKFAKPGKSMVCFEAVAQRSVTENPEFSHEATCAWVGRKPSLIDVSQTLPPPKLYMLELKDQYFCGIVSKLYLPNSALIVIQGDPTTVVAHVESFTKPLSTGFVVQGISDYVKLYDSVIFKIKEADSGSNLLVASDVRNRNI